MIEPIVIALVVVAAVFTILAPLERRLEDAKARIRVLTSRDAKRQEWLDGSCDLLRRVPGSNDGQTTQWHADASSLMAEVCEDPAGRALTESSAHLAGEVRMNRYRHAIGIGAPT